MNLHFYSSISIKVPGFYHRICLDDPWLESSYIFLKYLYLPSQEIYKNQSSDLIIKIKEHNFKAEYLFFYEVYQIVKGV